MTTSTLTLSRNRRRKQATLPQWPLVPAVAFIVVLFVIPVSQLLFLGFYDNRGYFTFANYLRIFEDSSYLNVLINTFSYATWTTLFCVALAYPIAYLIATSSPVWRSSILIWVLVPLWTSFLVRVLAWMVILGRKGVINYYLTKLGFPSLDLLYNFLGVMVGSIHALMPIAVLMMLSVMLNIDNNLVRAASTLGAPSSVVFWRVYFPLSLPGVISSALMVYVTSLGFFIAPQLLGGPSDIMLAQVIIVQLEQTLNWNFAAALSMILLIVTMLIIFLFNKVFGLSVLTGEASKANLKTQRKPSLLSIRILNSIGWTFNVPSQYARSIFKHKRRKDRNRRALLKIFGVLAVLFLAAPTFFLIPVSFSENRFLAWPPTSFTWQWYEAYFDSPIWRDATIRSLWVGFATACLSMILGVPAAFVLVRQHVPWKAVIVGTMLLPMVLPHIIIAVGLFYLYSNIGLVGTSIGLIIGNAIFSLPYVVITMMTVLKNYDMRLDLASWTLGATKIVTFRRITLPLLKAGCVTAFLFSFVKAVDELSIALFVADAKSTLLPKQLWQEISYKIDPSLAAISTLILIFVAGTIMIVQALSAIRARV